MLDPKETGHWLRTARAAVLAGALALALIQPIFGSAGNIAVSPSMMNDYARRHLRSPKTPSPNDTVFWAIAYPNSRGVQYLTAISDSGNAVLVFTSPFRNWAYAEGAPDVPHPWVGVGWTPAMAVERLRSIHDQSGVRWFVLDKSPTCEHFKILAIQPGLSREDLAGLWTAWRKIALDVGNRHFRDAVSAARTGDFQSAWDLDWQLLSCVIPEEPGLHVLAGACGISTANDRMIRTATLSLSWLDPPIASLLASAAARAGGKSASERRRIALGIVRLVDSVQTPLLRR